MLHCCKFKADNVYFLEDNDMFSSRRLSIGFCPICKKPVAELVEWRFDGAFNKQTLSGINANSMVQELKEQIICSINDANYKKLKQEPYGWKFGINKQTKDGKIRQYASDFYGNKKLIKSFFAKN